MKLFPLRFSYIAVCLFCITGLVFFSPLSLHAQNVTIPSANDNDGSDRSPLGDFYGYERTEALYTNAEIGSFGYVTQLAFFVNSVNVPSLSTPVVIKMMTTNAGSLTSNYYSSESAGATTVWSGNITSAMLVPGNWITITLTTPFNYDADNLLVFVETNFGSFGDEAWNAKQIRQGDAGDFLCQYWSDDQAAPTDLGVLNTLRPNVSLTLAPLCSGKPEAGVTQADVNPVCSNSTFNLSMSAIAVGAGLSYKWQSSTNGNTWNNISGATLATLAATQSAMKYYRCIVTCSNGGLTDTSTALQVNMQSFYHCYCASYATLDQDTKIDSVQLGSISTGSDPLACETYTDYTDQLTTLTPGQPNVIHIVNGSCSGVAYEAYVAVYIDFNHNGVYTDAGELVYSYGPIYDLHAIPNATFFVPLSALPDTTGMRVVLEEGDAVPLSCGTYDRGETEDYLVNIASVAACSGVPAADTAVASVYSVCENEPFDLWLTSYPAASGLTYQWQSSNDGNNYTTISSTFTYTVPSQSQATYYRCKITCTGPGGGIQYSEPVYITMNPFYKCYCASGAVSIDNDTKIDSVKFVNINTGSDPSHCESYTDYTATPTDVLVNQNTPIHIVNGSCDGQFYESYVAVYIDADQSGTYEPGELYYSYGPTTGLNSIPDGNIFIDNSATLGLTGMRVILTEGDSVPTACGAYYGGETEDYVVNLVNTPPCIDPPTPGTADASVDQLCGADLPASFTLSLTGNSTGATQTYQWQDSVAGGIWTDIPGATSTVATATINNGSVTTYYRCLVHCGQSTLSSSLDSVLVISPVGNTESNPIVVNSGFPYTDVRNNLTGNCWTSNYTYQNQQASPDVFYKVYTNHAAGTLFVSTCNTTDLNTYIHIFNAGDVVLVNNDNDGPLCAGQFASDTSVHATVSDEYFFVVVEGHASLEGNYQLDLDFVTANGEPAFSNNQASLAVFPNPTNGTFHLTMDMGQNITADAIVHVEDAIGRQVLQQRTKVVDGKLDEAFTLNREAAGLYLVTVNVNGTPYTQRLMVQQ